MKKKIFYQVLKNFIIKKIKFLENHIYLYNFDDINNKIFYSKNSINFIYK